MGGSHARYAPQGRNERRNTRSLRNCAALARENAGKFLILAVFVGLSTFHFIRNRVLYGMMMEVKRMTLRYER